MVVQLWQKKTHDLYACNYARAGTVHCGLRYVLITDNVMVSALFYARVTHFLQLYHHCQCGVHASLQPIWLQEIILLF